MRWRGWRASGSDAISYRQRHARLESAPHRCGDNRLTPAHLSDLVHTKRRMAAPQRSFPMIVQFMDIATGTAVYINPAYVISLRPDPADPDHVSIIQLRSGEAIR